MLTEDEKNKIRDEEAYRNKIESNSKNSKSFSDRIDGPLKLLGGISIAIGIFASLLQYRTNSKRQMEEAAREYQKSFYQAQMSVYAEAVNATSVLATADPDSSEYNEARDKFFQLFWGRMSMFEDKCVEARMVEFRRLLIKFEQHDYIPETLRDPCSLSVCRVDTINQITLKFASLRLAHQCRIYTIKTWLSEKERSSYNLIDTMPCPHN
jgi:hypothetical protein